MFGQVGVVIGVMLVIFAFMGMFGYIAWWLTRTPKYVLSPYTGMPLWRAHLLPYTTKKRVHEYLQSYHQYDNRPFDFRKAAYCRETGRLFPDCVTWNKKIVLDWSFIQKRYPGNWISWGSLSPEWKEKVRNKHENLDGFQIARSSTKPSPRQIEPTFAYLKPGPLYVDIDNCYLLGWKEVPDSQMEVFILQKPVR